MDSTVTQTITVYLSPDSPFDGGLPGKPSPPKSKNLRTISPYHFVCLFFYKHRKLRQILSFLPGFALVLVLLYALIVGKGYIRQCLLWLDHQEEWIVFAVFVFLYTAVSFPLTWGYIVLNLACGYHFGLFIGLVVTAIAASVGIAFAHLLMKHYFIQIIASKLLKMRILRATLAALQTTQAFKLIAISRLTPIPFGLQNAVFAISPICLWQYVGASAVGLFPTQVIGVYLGSSVRSMEEVLVNESTAFVGYIVLCVQVVLSVVLFIYILRRARNELNKALYKDLQGISVLNGVSSNLKNTTLTRIPYRWSKNGPGSCSLHQI